MALRVTQQHVETLGKGSGKLRVSQQQVDILIYVGSSGVSQLTLTQTADVVGTRAKDANSTLSLSQLATSNLKFLSAASQLLLQQDVYVPQTYYPAAASTLSLSQSTAISGKLRWPASSTLDLQQSADAGISNVVVHRSVVSSLALTQGASGGRVLVAASTLNLTQMARTDRLTVSATSVLNLDGEARYNPGTIGPGGGSAGYEYNLPATEISLTQSATSSIKMLSASNTLALSQMISALQPIHAAAESKLAWTESEYDPTQGVFVDVEYGLLQAAGWERTGPRAIQHYLQLTQTVGVIHIKATAIAVDAINWLSLNHAAVDNVTGEAVSSLTLTDEATAVIGIPLSSQLSLSQTATVTVDRAPWGQSTLELHQATTYTLLTASTECQYSPFVGSSTDPNAPTPPSTTLQGPMAGIQVPFQLVYPATGTVTDAVSLRAPNLGNRDRIALNRIQRETRGGTLVIFADPMWPKTQTLVLQFSGLLRTETTALLTFFEAHLGQEIGLIDWEHRYWRGVIITPDEPVVEDRFDSFSASFEFQGELDPTWNPQVVPPTLRYSAVRSPQQGGYYVPVEPQLPATPETWDYNSAETDSQIKIGYPVYVKVTGHIDPAQANAVPNVNVAGIAIEDKAATFACKYLTEGRVTRSDWTEVAGTTALTPGAVYFLSPTVAGKITTTAPVVGYIVKVGRAITTTQLDIEIESPILL